MFPFLGGPDHAGPPADPRTDRHAAPRAAAEHPHSQRADSEDCRRSTMMIQVTNIFKAQIKFSVK